MSLLPPLFNLYHQAVLHDFRARRKRSAESAGITPGIEWKVFVDGRLTRHRTYYQIQANSKVHIFGDLEFADDTATTATASEFPLADQLLEQTFTDWGEKLNRAKTETLLLKPGTPPEQRRDPPTNIIRYAMSAAYSLTQDLNGRIPYSDAHRPAAALKKLRKLGPLELIAAAAKPVGLASSPDYA